MTKKKYWVYVKKCLSFFGKRIDKTQFGRGAQRYFRTVFDAAIKMTVMAFFSGLIACSIFYIIKSFWGVYTSTQVGAEFVVSFPEKAAFLSSLTSHFSVLLIIKASLNVILICVGITVVCQFLCFARFFYYSRGFFGKMVWGAAVAGIAAYRLWDGFDVDTFSVGYCIVFIPTMFTLPYSFQLAEAAIPEVGDIFIMTKRAVGMLKRKFLQDPLKYRN